MDQEAKAFMEESFEKWTGVISGEFAKMNSRMDKVQEDMGMLKEEVQETRSAVLNIESFLKEKVEIQGVRQRVECIEDHVVLSHSLDPA